MGHACQVVFMFRRQLHTPPVQSRPLVQLSDHRRCQLPAARSLRRRSRRGCPALRFKARELLVDTHAALVVFRHLHHRPKQKRMVRTLCRTLIKAKARPQTTAMFLVKHTNALGRFIDTAPPPLADDSSKASHGPPPRCLRQCCLRAGLGEWPCL